MALATVKQLVAPTALTATTSTTLYTTPASTTTIIKEVLLCNTDTSARTVTLFINGSAAANTILSAVQIAAGETKIFTFSTVLPTTQTLKGGASAGAVVSITVSGVEVA